MRRNNLRSDIHNASASPSMNPPPADIVNLFNVLLGDAHGLDIDTLDKEVALDSRSIQKACCNDAILTHPVFNRYHSETEMIKVTCTL